VETITMLRVTSTLNLICARTSFKRMRVFPSRMRHLSTQSRRERWTLCKFLKASFSLLSAVGSKWSIAKLIQTKTSTTLDALKQLLLRPKSLFSNGRSHSEMLVGQPGHGTKLRKHMFPLRKNTKLSNLRSEDI